MLIIQSKQKGSGTPEPWIADLIETVSEEYLWNTVEKLSIPRHFIAEPANNRAVRDWIEREFQAFGLPTFRQGAYSNVLAAMNGRPEDALFLVGAHYDSVPGSSGADDNASALAGMLAAAKVLAAASFPCPIAFVAFNREEDGLLGSSDFVSNFLQTIPARLREVHILEMIGYCDYRPQSQSIPQGLPLKMPDIGDFLALVANKDSNPLIDKILLAGNTYLPALPVNALKVYLGIEKIYPHLSRSDHAPFWQARIPAVMWTDTSEFRNPHYHQRTDLPDTLDYEFLRRVTQLLVAHLAAAVP